MSITELKGKKEVGYKEESIYGTNGDKLSLVAYNADNIRIEYTLTVSSENIKLLLLRIKPYPFPCIITGQFVWRISKVSSGNQPSLAH